MKKDGSKKFTLAILLLVVLGLSYYTYLNNNAGKRKAENTTSDVEKYLNYDFENDYPKTVRETVKLHCNYLKNAYNDMFTQEELFQVNQNIRQLFDQELLAINSEESQLQGMKDEIALYKEKKQKLISFTLAEGSQVQYNTEGDTEYAKMRVSLTFTVDTSSATADEEYILRKDSEGRWKILGWQMVKTESASETKGDAQE